MDRVLTLQFNASAASIASSTACRFNTGSAPGNPIHTGQTFELGSAPKLVGHPQKILVRVASWTWTSSPITGSYFAITSADAMFIRLDDMFLIISSGAET